MLIKDSFNIELNQSNVADVYQRMGNDALCFEYAFKSLYGAKRPKDTIGMAWIDNILSRVSRQHNNCPVRLHRNLISFHPTKTYVNFFAIEFSQTTT